MFGPSLNTSWWCCIVGCLTVRRPVQVNTPPRNANNRRGRIDLSKMEVRLLLGWLPTPLSSRTRAVTSVHFSRYCLRVIICDEDA
jgi:hypothetical protein